MSYRERKEKILELLDINDTLSYAQLAESLIVSEATVRRDLTRMSEEKLILRYWGGAKRNPDRAIPSRSILDCTVTDEIRTIAQIAGELVHDDELIFIGPGLTTLTMIDYITTTHVTIVTNGIPQLEKLKLKGIKAFLLCGFLKDYSRTVISPQTIRMLSSYKFDKSFIGVIGLDTDLSLLSADGYEHDLKAVAIANSKESYILADHKKYGRTAMFSQKLRPEDHVTLISDQKLGSESLGWRKLKRGYALEI